MKIGIIGAGHMAEALGTPWAAIGHDVLLGSRTPDRAAALAESIGHGARSGSRRDAAEFGDAVLLAVPDAAVAAALADAGAPARTLAGRVLIDCTNPVEHGTGRQSAVAAPSMAEHIADLTAAHVVKGFNLCPSDVWRVPVGIGGQPLAVPLCGDDSHALDVVSRLVTDLGCKPVVTGDLHRASQLEAVAGYIIGLAFAGVDPHATFTMIPGDSPERRPSGVQTQPRQTHPSQR
jgi:predicted dinucleotide-binding enzyme